ncbi:MAG: Ribosomal RNA large subunit methyltransferase I [Anaerolineales bacterium]|nr:Ribosomal RNA large subunit methyltransferase I [Anaerolineales bacterium]
MTDLILKPGREKPIQNRHPWVFSGAIREIDGDFEPGDVVTVRAHDRQFLGRGYFNPESQIAVRMLTWSDEAIDEAFWRRRLQQAIAVRDEITGLRDTTAYRLVNAESDGLPGLIVDRYNDFLVIQALTLGIERWKEMLIEWLTALLEPQGIVERSDVDVRAKEGLPAVVEAPAGGRPPDLIEIQEHGRRFLVDLMHGHKTGFYLDQRVNRRRIAGYARDREVLNAFAYTGGFGIYATAAGATSVVHIDTSEEALELARRNVALNEASDVSHAYVAGDVFQVLRDYRDTGRQFDLIVLDPPKFAHTKSQVRAACRGYKDINWLAFRLLRSGGVLFTFSCSGLVSPELFQKVVFGAAMDAGRDAQVLERLTQAPDHAFRLSFPEGEYLKGFVCRVAE